MLTERGKSLGELEAIVLEALWGAGKARSVREVLELVQRRPALAYTTILTVLDRLHDKGLVSRQKEGKAFRYWARVSREQWLGEQAAEVLTRLPLQSDGAVLMAFLDSADRADPKLLEQLSLLIATRRKRGKE
jgi:predicted transcriptional regulator